MTSRINPDVAGSPGLPLTRLPRRVLVTGALDWVRKMLLDSVQDQELEMIDGGDPAMLSWTPLADAFLFDARVDPDAALLALESIRIRDWSTPAVFLVAREDGEVIAEALRLGVSIILHPPVDGQRLREILAEVTAV